MKHYHINADTGERTLNTDFNHFIFLNLIAYVANLVLVITIGAFGVITNTTNILSYSFQSLVTVDELFFQLAWATSFHCKDFGPFGRLSIPPNETAKASFGRPTTIHWQYSCMVDTRFSVASTCLSWQPSFPTASVQPESDWP